MRWRRWTIRRIVWLAGCCASAWARPRSASCDAPRGTARTPRCRAAPRDWPASSRTVIVEKGVGMLTQSMLLACLALVGSVILAARHRPVLFPVIAAVASALEVLMAFGLVH